MDYDSQKLCQILQQIEVLDSNPMKPNLTLLKGSNRELKYIVKLQYPQNLTHILHFYMMIKLLHFLQFSNTLVLYVVSVGINKITFEI